MTSDNKAVVNALLGKFTQTEEDSDDESVAHSIKTEGSQASTKVAATVPEVKQETKSKVSDYITYSEAHELLHKVINTCYGDNMRVKFNGKSNTGDGLTISMLIDPLLPKVTTEQQDPLATVLQWFLNTVHYQKSTGRKSAPPEIAPARIKVRLRVYEPHRFMAVFELDKVVVTVFAIGKCK